MLTLVSKKTRLIVASAMLVLGVSSAALAAPYWSPLTIIKPGNSVNGQSPKELGQKYWQWAAVIPPAKNPITDSTGVNCSQGQEKNGLLFFLPGSFESGPVVRSCKVPAGKTIAFPVLTGLYGAFPTDPASERTDAFVRAQVDYLKDAYDLSVEVDGQKLDNATVKKYLVESARTYQIDLPADNIYGAGKVTLKPTADKGYYVGISPIWVPGKYVVKFKGKVQSDGETFAQDITWNLDVSYGNWVNGRFQ